MLAKELEEETNKWKYVSGSWSGRISVKMSKRHKVIYGANAIHTKSLTIHTEPPKTINNKKKFEQQEQSWGR